MSKIKSGRRGLLVWARDCVESKCCVLVLETDSRVAIDATGTGQRVEALPCRAKVKARREFVTIAAPAPFHSPTGPHLEQRRGSHGPVCSDARPGDTVPTHEARPGVWSALPPADSVIYTENARTPIIAGRHTQHTAAFSNRTLKPRVHSHMFVSVFNKTKKPNLERSRRCGSQG